MLYGLLLLLPILWLSWATTSLLRNYRSARQINLPIILSPISTLNLAWRAFRGRAVPILKYLPYHLGAFARINYFGDRYGIYEELGDAVICVTSGNNELYLSNAEAVDDFLSRRKAFPKWVKIHSK
jgi:hypothetical protein